MEKSIVEKVSTEVTENVCARISSSVDNKIAEAIEPIVSKQQDFKEETETRISNLETKVLKLNSLLSDNSARSTSSSPSYRIAPPPKVTDGANKDISMESDTRTQLASIVSNAKCIV